MALPMKFELDPPINSGVMKSPRVSEKVKIEPATIPGRIIGIRIWRKVNHEPAPKSAEASRSESGTRSKAP